MTYSYSFFFCSCTMFVLIYRKYLLIYMICIIKKKKTRWSMRIITYNHYIEYQIKSLAKNLSEIRFNIFFFFFFSRPSQIRHWKLFDSPINAFNLRLVRSIFVFIRLHISKGFILTRIRRVSVKKIFLQNWRKKYFPRYRIVGITKIIFIHNNISNLPPFLKTFRN